MNGANISRHLWLSHCRGFLLASRAEARAAAPHATVHSLEHRQCCSEEPCSAARLPGSGFCQPPGSDMRGPGKGHQRCELLHLQNGNHDGSEPGPGPTSQWGLNAPIPALPTISFHWLPAGPRNKQERPGQMSQPGVRVPPLLPGAVLGASSRDPLRVERDQERGCVSSEAHSEIRGSSSSGSFGRCYQESPAAGGAGRKREAANKECSRRLAKSSIPLDT